MYTDEAYLFALVGLLLSCTDCGKTLGLDAPVLEEDGAAGNGVGGGGRGGATRSQPPDTVPHWHVALLRFQVHSKRAATKYFRVVPRLFMSISGEVCKAWSYCILWHLYTRTDILCMIRNAFQSKQQRVSSGHYTLDMWMCCQLRCVVVRERCGVSCCCRH